MKRDSSNTTPKWNSSFSLRPYHASWHRLIDEENWVLFAIRTVRNTFSVADTFYLRCVPDALRSSRFFLLSSNEFSGWCSSWFMWRKSYKKSCLRKTGHCFVDFRHEWHKPRREWARSLAVFYGSHIRYKNVNYARSIANTRTSPRSNEENCFGV